MLRVVLTGAPCSGKTTIVNNLLDRYGHLVTVAQESAMMLFSMGYPIPGRGVSWEEWQLKWFNGFQQANFNLRLFLEEQAQIIGSLKGHEVVICDRGLLDSASYEPDSAEEFCYKHNHNLAEILNRYDLVIQLQSLAETDVDAFAGQVRYEDAQTIAKLSARLQNIWGGHPGYHFVNATVNFEEKIKAVVSILNQEKQVIPGR